MTTPSTLMSGLRRPETQTDLLQILKAVIATVGAWLVAVRILDLEQAFLAAWAALLTIHATVYRTFWRGFQSVVATFLGIVLSYLATAALGYGALSLGVAVLGGLLLARTRVIKEEGIAVATTALFVITSGYGSQEALLLDRFLDTLVGVAVGIVVNVVVVPPLDDKLAERALDLAAADLGNLLQRMADDLRQDMTDEPAEAWIAETRRIDERLDHAQQQLTFSQESQWANLRRRRTRRMTDVDLGTELLVRLEEGVAQARTIARVVDESVVGARTWDDEFRDRWTDLVRRVGRRIADPDADVHALKGPLEDLARDLSHEDLPHRYWPIYGALVTALLNIINIVDDIASDRDGLRPA
jgi:uncharacterized membrane protein YgaE (UPF0421/DUF939 family)